MNEPQKRAYIILHAELEGYNFLLDAGFRACELIDRVRGILDGRRMAVSYSYQTYHSKFSREVQKILHLTDMSIEDMIAVLEKLWELWKPR